MNAAQELHRLLDQYRAVLVRQNNHLVYRLPNGQNLVVAKTPSDPDRAAKKNLSCLRRALGIGRPAQAAESEPQVQTTEQPAPAGTALESSQPDSLKDRLRTAIATEEAAQERLLAQAQAHERRATLLKALLPFAEDPATEDALRGVLPDIQPPVPLPPPLEPPQQITERVQVTRKLVFAATQTFDGTFTVNDVLALMTGGNQIDGRERLRVRQSIAQAMMTLYERGELIREQEGIGKRQSVWRKAALEAKGVGTRA